MKLEIHFDSLQSYKEFADEPIPKGVSVCVDACNTIDVPSLVIVTLDFIRNRAIDVDVGLFVVWLCQQAKKHPCKYKYREKNITPKEDILRRLIQKEFDLVDNKKRNKKRDAK